MLKPQESYLIFVILIKKTLNLNLYLNSIVQVTSPDVAHRRAKQKYTFLARLVEQRSQLRKKLQCFKEKINENEINIGKQKK